MEKARSLKFRRLGPVSTELPDWQSSFYAELETENSELQQLKQEMRRMQAKLTAIEKSLKRHTQITRKHSVFLEDSYALSIRAFSDFIVDAVFSAAHIEGLDATERATWLMGNEGKKFFADKEGDVIPLLGGNLIVSGDLLEKVRSLRSLSSNLSESRTHHTTALKVALALGETQVVKDVENFITTADLNSIFEAVFKISPEVVVEQWKRRALDDKFKTSFGKRKYK